MNLPPPNSFFFLISVSISTFFLSIQFLQELKFSIAQTRSASERNLQEKNMSSPSKRRDMDVMKLMMTDYKVETVDDSVTQFFVEFNGPPDSLYSGGVWRVRVELPDAYQYKSPSIGFINRIYHPNIDEMSGSVCLDVINQTWSPMFDLVNIFEVFLPQLLLYPNPADPLNGEAAALMMRDRPVYEQKVKEHCLKYAKPEDLENKQADDEESDDDDYENYKTSDDEMEVEGL
ncbi:hypothetical protein C5167_040117 [Papaver somniferum]|uniref:E2 ubiquitin-conjugating enzyme n=1 Tax=Papaver somniferum TaxID=3469 RepID=A0A4Y7II91_PAPSO|nr:ubiquitin-conjugating enzyme E2 5-like [Papaver somniferum]RZC47165.1 hypothetical protein C5167_040117 [Papaver somniferum]